MNAPDGFRAAPSDYDLNDQNKKVQDGPQIPKRFAQNFLISETVNFLKPRIGDIFDGDNKILILSPKSDCQLTLLKMPFSR